MNCTNETILKQAGDVHKYVVDIRRTIHRNPELGMQEKKTAALICSNLEEMGIPYRSGVGGTGVVGIIDGTAPGEGKVIALRADMDALPIQEASDVEYKSQVDGVFHACGHDAHVAMLLGAARILSENRHWFPGKVVLLFQPAEEGPGGAEPMVKDGALDNPPVDGVIGFHVASADPTGIVKVTPGPMHAAVTEVRIIIRGRGGHAAYPHRSVDAIVLAAQAIMSFQTVISRRVDPVTPAVFTIGTINGGYRHNVIADEVVMTGTFRYFDDRLRDDLVRWTREILDGITKPVGGDYEIGFIFGYPATINHEEFSRFIGKHLTDLLGPEKVLQEKEPSMGGEDFSYFARKVPGVFMMLGTRGKNGEYAHPHHHPCFDIDEEAMKNGVASFVKIAVEFNRGGMKL